MLLSAANTCSAPNHTHFQDSGTGTMAAAIKKKIVVAGGNGFLGKYQDTPDTAQLTSEQEAGYARQQSPGTGT